MNGIAESEIMKELTPRYSVDRQATEGKLTSPTF